MTDVRRDRPSLVRPSLFALTWNVAVWGGWAVLAFAVARAIGDGLVSVGPALLMLTVLVVVSELRPAVTRVFGGDTVSSSLAFVLAALYLWGPVPALLLQALSGLIGELVARKPPWKLLFNIGQYELSLLAAWVVMVVAGVTPSPSAPLEGLRAADLGWIVLTWVVYHLVNLALVAGLCESDDQTWWASFTEDFWFYTLSTLAVVAISPLVVLAAVASPQSWVFMPLLLVPVMAVNRTAELVQQREHESLHDHLTGLPNRKLLSSRAERVLAGARPDRGVTLFLLDLDRFKEVNDTLGHATGDRLLEVVARRVAGAVRPSDTVARLGGDEFGVLLPGVTDESEADVVAGRVRATLAEPIHLDGVLLDVEVSIGMARAIGPGTPFEELLREADVAMYVAKGTRSGVAMYRPELDPHSAQRLGAVTRLREGLDARELEVHYQPKVAARGGAVVGMEALVRWRDPERGLVGPEDFVPLAERSGLVHRMTAYVLAEALDQARAWWDVGLKVPVAVNVSMRDLQETDLPARVDRELRRTGLPASALVLEVTESVLVQEPTRAVAALRRLAERGVLASMDDFGTGYTTLALLEHLPVSELKIDRSFVSHLGHPDASPAMVGSIIALAHALGLTVVAEGVETEAVRASLERLEVDAVQGWLVARPMPPEHATRWLLERAGARGTGLRLLPGSAG
ncbi:MAG: EAL domain-containing protein [Candidatus Nanopelagicales bacterium]